MNEELEKQIKNYEEKYIPKPKPDPKRKYICRVDPNGSHSNSQRIM